MDLVMRNTYVITLESYYIYSPTQAPPAHFVKAMIKTYGRISFPHVQITTSKIFKIAKHKQSCPPYHTNTKH